MRHRFLFGLIAAFTLINATVSAGEPLPRIPNFIGEADVTNRNIGSTVRAVRFVTTLDFPPFNYLDDNQRLTGFNVYLAKAICSELKIEATCTIQAMPFEEMTKAVTEGRADAIISGLESNVQTLEQFSFTKSYLRFPGRFVSRKNNSEPIDFDNGLNSIAIGAVAGSGHEKLVRSYFPNAKIVGIASEQLLIAELNSEKVDLIFGAGLNLSFWVNGAASKGCCQLIGGAYYSSVFLGEGMRIAAPNSRPDIIQSIDQALTAIQKKKGIEELFLRFFPNSFY